MHDNKWKDSNNNIFTYMHMCALKYIYMYVGMDGDANELIRMQLLESHWQRLQ